MITYSICLSLSDLFHYVYFPGPLMLLQMAKCHSFLRLSYILLCVCMYVCVLSRFSHVLTLATSWTVARQALLSMGFSRQEYWSGCYALLLCVCVCVCVCTHTLQVFFFFKPHLIYLSLFDGHLGCFHVLAIVNNPAMNRRVAYLFKLVFSFSLGIYPPTQ